MSDPKSTAIVPVTSTALRAAPSQLTYSDDERKLIVESFMPGASDGEARALLRVSEVMGLNVFKRQIHFVKRKQKDGDRFVERWTFQTSIDGYRAKAEETGEYEGQDEPTFTTEEGFDPSGRAAAKRDLVARVTVYRRGRRPCVGVARWSEYAQTFPDGNPIAMWAKMPRQMLAKCAEAQAFRKTFPDAIGGTYIDDEIPTEDDHGRPILKAEIAPLTPAAPPPADWPARYAACATLDEVAQTDADVKASGIKGAGRAAAIDARKAARARIESAMGEAREPGQEG